MKLLKPIKLKNRFTLLPIHYTHAIEDGKHLPEWRDEMASTYPRPENFDREMEIDFGLKIGALAYPRFDEIKHTGRNLPYDERRPLHAAFDFNTNPMSLVVDQVYETKKRLLVLREFVYGPTTIDAVVNDFRNTYASHKADVVVYGDATKGTNAQTAKSNWDVVRLAFRGYHITPQYRVGLANPNIGDRLNAVNRMFQSPDWQIVIDVDRCPELVRDLNEVILDTSGKKIHKVTDPDDPYYFRTHASDAWGYRIFREFPVVAEVVSLLRQKREPMEPGRLLGDVQMGTQREELARRLKSAKRKPLERPS